MNILTLNAGSSTLKYKLFSMPDEIVLADGNLDHPGGKGIAQAAVDAIEKCLAIGIDAVGHRVVHGGPHFSDPVIVTLKIMAVLHSLKELDPLHNPVETSMIQSGLDKLPDTPAVAAFDTAFHKTIPEIAWRYALPRDETERYGLRRYGFHGLSYEYVSSELLQCLGRNSENTRLIICHLGSGASVCAIRDGNSVDTSMGMTPLEGVVMGTRSGDIDPGLLLYLQRTAGMTAAQLDHLLNNQSGLLGISGISSDVRELEKAVSGGNKLADLALEIFAYHVCKYIGAYAAVLEGLDAIAFTGGIGEHSANMRSRICRRLSFMGIHLSDEHNNDLAEGDPSKISIDHDPIQVWVIPTNEELQIARNVQNVLTAL